MNSYETQAISEQFLALGFEIVPYGQKADVYVVNTCSVTGEAARKSRQILNRAKKINPDAVTVATGCYAQEAAAALSDRADLIIGNNEKSRIARLALEIVQKRQAEGVRTETASLQLVDDLSRCCRYENQRITNQGSHVRAYVKIQDGCNRFCSYCIIPYLRGRSRSRAFEDILKETKTLVRAGYREIVLTGIDISDFCLCQGDVKKGPEESLCKLLFALDTVSGLERIRLGSLEEGILTEAFTEKLSSLKHLCPQFHLSLQSGSDTVLKRMNRKYTTDQFRQTVLRLRKAFPVPAITTDIIAGFPQETDEEFEETLSFVEEMKFASVHVFKYSRRKGTAADRMEGQLTDRVKTERSEKLIRLAESMSAQYREQFLGTEKDILFEECVVAGGRCFQTGFTPEYFKVAVETAEDLRGQIRAVKLTPEMLENMPAEKA